MTDIWQASVYTKFLDSRTRPARDLLFGIPQDFTPQSIVDLGCGPGNSTILLKDRWPAASLIGMDSSVDMINEARVTYPDLLFLVDDIGTFMPNEKVDLVFANASLQWLSDHQTVFSHIFSYIKKGGMFAFQMPNNFHMSSHQVIINLLQTNANWSHLLDDLRYGRLYKPFYDVKFYYDLCTNIGVSNLNIWETEYFHEMDNYHKIFEWVEGTSLRPVLTNMDEIEKKEFAKQYVEAVSHEYPLQSNQIILLPYLRLFMIGQVNF